MMNYIAALQHPETNKEAADLLKKYDPKQHPFGLGKPNEKK